MLKTTVLPKFAMLMIAALAFVVSPGIMYAHHPEKESVPIPFTALPAANRITQPPAGMGSIVWTNYNGGSNELDVDLAGMRFRVPPEANSTPSRVEINLAPGTYSYTASVPGMTEDISRTVDVAAGQVVGLGFYSASPDIVVHNHHSLSHSNKQHTSVTRNDFDELLFAQGDLTAQAH
jgi:hypothetical protein